MHNIPPERPRYEPEIIPPDPRRDAQFRPRPRDFGGEDGFAFNRQFATNDNVRPRVFLWRPGPLKIALILLGVGMGAGVFIAVLFGAILVAVPIAAVGVLGLIAYAKLRRFWLRMSQRTSVPRRR